MNKLYLPLLLLAFSGHAFSQDFLASEWVPEGFVIQEKLSGDLNKDGKADWVLIVKGTDQSKVIIHEYRGELDRNRRGVIVVFKTADGYKLALENLSCFSSENEDGGVYYAPELVPEIKQGKLFIRYLHGRYGGWKYNFRYKKGDFELIGYDSNSNRGPLIESETSINFLSKKMLLRENINADGEPGEERFKETWQSFKLASPIKLSEIEDFDELDMRMINLQP